MVSESAGWTSSSMTEAVIMLLVTLKCPSLHDQFYKKNIKPIKPKKLFFVFNLNFNNAGHWYLNVSAVTQTFCVRKQVCDTDLYMSNQEGLMGLD